MNAINRTSFVPSSPSSTVPIALLLNVILLAGAGFVLYRFRQAWLTSKVFFPVTIAGSSVGVVALAALNCAILRSKRVNPTKIEAPLPAPPEPPPYDRNPGGVVQVFQPEARQTGSLDSLPNELILKIMMRLSPSDLSTLMRASRRLYALGKQSFLWKPLLDREWMGSCPASLCQGGDAVYLNWCKLQRLAKQGMLRRIISESELNDSLRQGASCIAVTSDRKIIMGLGGGIVEVWDSKATQMIARLVGHTRTVNCVTYTSDGKIITGSEDETVRVWDSTTGNQLACLTGHTNAVRSVAVTPDGKIISQTFGVRNGVLVWDSQTGQMITRLNLRGATCLVATPYGTIISGAWDKTVKVWDSQTGDRLACLAGHGKQVTCVAAVSDRIIVSGSRDKTVMVWDIKTMKMITCFARHKGHVTCVAAVSDRIIASGSKDKTVMVWDSKTGQMIACLGHNFEVLSLAVTPDGKIISRSYDRSVRVFEYDAQKFHICEFRRFENSFFRRLTMLC